MMKHVFRWVPAIAHSHLTRSNVREGHVQPPAASSMPPFDIQTSYQPRVALPCLLIASDVPFSRPAFFKESQPPRLVWMPKYNMWTRFKFSPTDILDPCKTRCMSGHLYQSLRACCDGHTPPGTFCEKKFCYQAHIEDLMLC